MAQLENISIEKSGAWTHPAISVYSDETLLSSLKKMRDNWVSSVAVIDHQCHLLGNISVSDLKLFWPHQSTTKVLTLGALEAPASSFVTELLTEEGLRRGRDRFPFFEIPFSASLATAIKKLIATRSHRVWIVSNENTSAKKLEGVTSMTDIVKSLLSYLK